MGLFNFKQRVDILDIASWFLSKESMSQKKLQKLCYYAEAWSQALRGKPIAQRAEFQAWVHGPVNLELRRKYAGFGWDDIPQDTANYEILDSEDGLVALLESVWNTYGDKDGDSLEILTHQEAPWIEARGGLPEFTPSNKEISTKTMRDFYLSIYKK
jgi:putative prophage protein (ps3)